MNFWLAPLHGITYYYFRNCLVRHTSSIKTAITPFFSIQETTKLNIKKWKDILPENNQTLEVIPQLIGNNPLYFLQTVNKLAEFGYQRFNWNIGCPVAQITRKQRGCGLMPFPQKVEDVIRLVTKESPQFKISIKMRLGFVNIAESEEIIQRLNKYPLDFIVLHPRLGMQQYEGFPDYEIFEKRANISKHRMIYSGDIDSVEKFYELEKRFPNINDWMLGRGILQNPFLIEQILANKNEKIENKNTYHQRMLLFYDDLIKTFIEVGNERGALAHLKELWHYLSITCQLTKNEKQNLLRIDNLTSFINVTKNILKNKYR